MNQTRDFEELDWAEDPSAVGFSGPDAVAVDGSDELDLELGTGCKIITAMIVFNIYVLHLYLQTDLRFLLSDQSILDLSDMPLAVLIELRPPLFDLNQLLLNLVLVKLSTLYLMV